MHPLELVRALDQAQLSELDLVIRFAELWPSPAIGPAPPEDFVALGLQEPWRVTVAVELDGQPARMEIVSPLAGVTLTRDRNGVAVTCVNDRLEVVIERRELLAGALALVDTRRRAAGQDAWADAAARSLREVVWSDRKRLGRLLPDHQPTPVQFELLEILELPEAWGSGDVVARLARLPAPALRWETSRGARLPGVPRRHDADARYGGQLWLTWSLTHPWSAVARIGESAIEIPGFARLSPNPWPEALMAAAVFDGRAVQAAPRASRADPARASAAAPTRELIRALAELAPATPGVYIPDLLALYRVGEERLDAFAARYADRRTLIDIVELTTALRHVRDVLAAEIARATARAAELAGLGYGAPGSAVAIDEYVVRFDHTDGAERLTVTGPTTWSCTSPRGGTALIERLVAFFDGPEQAAALHHRHTSSAGR